MTNESWDALRAELAEQLPALTDRDTLILSHGDRYVQWRQSPAFLSVQAVSNEFLPPEEQLSAEAESALERLGWNRPHGPGRHNWWKDQPWPLNSDDAKEIADLMVSTLRDVFDVPDPKILVKEAFNG